MRIGNSTPLSDAIAGLIASASGPTAQEADQNQEFAEEMASASQAEAAQAPDAGADTVLKRPEPKMGVGSGSVLPVIDGLIGLGPSRSDGTHELTAPAPAPVSAFNLVTSSDSSSLANQCRSVVDAALKDRGMDPSLFKMSFWEEAVSYPGGGYLNGCITVETPEGARMDFDAALTLQSPNVTAEGIRMLRSGQWSTTAAVDA